jgi:hypothetical protein
MYYVAYSLLEPVELVDEPLELLRLLHSRQNLNLRDCYVEHFLIALLLLW